MEILTGNNSITHPRWSIRANRYPMSHNRPTALLLIWFMGMALCNCGRLEFDVLTAQLTDDDAGDDAGQDSETDTEANFTCGDEDPETPRLFYPDCDGDKTFDGKRSVRACDEEEASQLFQCADGTPPEGGWSKIPGDDCNDEDNQVQETQRWYPDCDGDGIPSPAATSACGKVGANMAFQCLDGQSPDGDWLGVQGSDCNDEDKHAQEYKNWYPDCDGDGAFSPRPTFACGESQANAVFRCTDGSEPKAWSPTAGDDCEDDTGQTC